MRKDSRNNFAFIDIQNVTMRLREMNWDFDWRRFYVYLEEKYCVTRAFIFVGYISRNKYFYDFLRSCGYILIFKPAIKAGDKNKANCDGDMILFVISKTRNYNKAVLMTSDGDFYSTVRFLNRYNKLATVLSVSADNCSKLLKKEAREKIVYLSEFKDMFERSK